MSQMTLDQFFKLRIERIREAILKEEILDLDDLLYIMDVDPDLYEKYKGRWFK